MNRWNTYGLDKKPCKGQGNDLKGKQELSLNDCKDLCTATSNCNSLAWGSKDGVQECWIKDKSDACFDTACDWNYDGDWHWFWLACSGTML